MVRDREDDTKGQGCGGYTEGATVVKSHYSHSQIKAQDVCSLLVEIDVTHDA